MHGKNIEHGTVMGAENTMWLYLLHFTLRPPWEKELRDKEIKVNVPTDIRCPLGYVVYENFRH